MLEFTPENFRDQQPIAVTYAGEGVAVIALAATTKSDNGIECEYSGLAAVAHVHAVPAAILATAGATAVVARPMNHPSVCVVACECSCECTDTVTTVKGWAPAIVHYSLSHAPNAPTTVSFTVRPGHASVRPSALTFHEDDWETPQVHGGATPTARPLRVPSIPFVYDP